MPPSPPPRVPRRRVPAVPGRAPAVVPRKRQRRFTDIPKASELPPPPPFRHCEKMFKVGNVGAVQITRVVKKARVSSEHRTLLEERTRLLQDLKRKMGDIQVCIDHLKSFTERTDVATLNSGLSEARRFLA